MAMLWDLVEARNETPGEPLGPHVERNGAHKVISRQGETRLVWVHRPRVELRVDHFRFPLALGLEGRSYIGDERLDLAGVITRYGADGWEPGRS